MRLQAIATPAGNHKAIERARRRPALARRARGPSPATGYRPYVLTIHPGMAEVERALIYGGIIYRFGCHTAKNQYYTFVNEGKGKWGAALSAPHR